MENQKQNTEKSETNSAREAAKDFLRPHLMTRNLWLIRLRAGSDFQQNGYSIGIVGNKIQLTGLCDIDNREEFTLEEIFHDLMTESFDRIGISVESSVSASQDSEGKKKGIKILLIFLEEFLGKYEKRFENDSESQRFMDGLNRVANVLKDILAFLSKD